MAEVDALIERLKKQANMRGLAGVNEFDAATALTAQRDRIAKLERVVEAARARRSAIANVERRYQEAKELGETVFYDASVHEPLRVANVKLEEALAALDAASPEPQPESITDAELREGK